MKKTIRLSLFLTAILFLINSAHADFRISANGTNGYDGNGGTYYGDNGGPGTHGSNAGDININASFNGQGQLLIRGVSDGENIEKVIDPNGQMIFLYALGGNGGNGGNGARGLAGRDGRIGQQGYAGRRGRNGRNGAGGTRHSPNGKNGTSAGAGTKGGDGYRGSDGGNGGRGGSAGYGGNAGDGGSIIVKYQDPAVLMHLNSMAKSGTLGHPGFPGEGGRRGYGGRGGAGGIGGKAGRTGRGGLGYRCSSREREDGCRDGVNGRDGNRGYSGRNGRKGTSGFHGTSGHAGDLASGGAFSSKGNFTYQLIDSNGKVLESHHSNVFYKLKIESFDLIDENEDSIYEPGEMVYIKNIIVKNIGTMDMPSGGQILIDGNEKKFLLPEIKIGQTKTILKTWPYKISEKFEIGSQQNIIISPSFHGLSFHNGELLKKIKVQRPVIISNIKVSNHFKFNEKKKLIISVKNISTKDYSTIKLSYLMNGKLSFNIDQKINNIAAGETAKEYISYEATNALAPYETSSLDFSLYRESILYKTTRIPLQVVSSYEDKKDSDILLLINGLSEETYTVLVQNLNELNMNFTIYDLRVNLELTTHILDQYKNKHIFMANDSGDLTDEMNLLSEHLLVSGGVIGFNLPRTLKTNHYYYRTHQSEDNFHQLSSAQQAKRFVKAILDTTSFENKLLFMRTRYLKNEETFLIPMREALSAQLEDEFYEAKYDESIYKNAENLVWKLDQYITAMNSANEFDMKAYFFGIVPSLWEFKELGGRYKTFLKNWGNLSSLYSEYGYLEDSCQSIKGSYISHEGVIIRFENEFRKKTQGDMSSGEFTFKGKRKMRDGGWKLKYKNSDGEKRYAYLSTSCEGPRVILKIILDNERELYFTKYLMY